MFGSVLMSWSRPICKVRISHARHVINNYFTLIWHVNAMRAVNRWKNHDLLQELCRATRLTIVDRYIQTPAHENRKPHRELIHPHPVHCIHAMTWLLWKYEDPDDQERPQQNLEVDEQRFAIGFEIELGGLEWHGSELNGRYVTFKYRTKVTEIMIYYKSWARERGILSTVHWQKVNVLQELGVQHAEPASAERFHAPVKRLGQGQFTLSNIFKRKQFLGRL